MSIRQLVAVALAVTVAFAGGYRAAGHGQRSAPSPVKNPDRDARTGAFVSFRDGNGRVARSLVVNESRGPDGITRYAPADADADWWIEVGGVVYLCTPR